MRPNRRASDLVKEISDGHMDYAEKFDDLLQSACNPNLPTVAKDFGFTVLSTEVETGARGRTIAVCANITVALAAWECACSQRPLASHLRWNGRVRFSSEQFGHKRVGAPSISLRNCRSGMLGTFLCMVLSRIGPAGVSGGLSTPLVATLCRIADLFFIALGEAYAIQ